ncbi:MAG: phosphoribosylformylglycinamidine synthase subunit PurQ [Armatimonadetes bacterium]|nr:phosphoribosylformylglycinamidine synthase subunit PurQ [Armatimonadota bacterium]
MTPADADQPTRRLRWGVVVFPGTNCEYDTEHVLGSVLGQEVRRVWHRETDLADLDAVVLPGGFAHGDYLRSGAIARFSPVMESVAGFAAAGRPVLGICNGFQVLLEAGLLPGAMLPNRSRRFSCRWVHLRVESSHSPFLAACRPGRLLHMPMAHGEGCYYVEDGELQEMERRGQVVLRYAAADGSVSDAVNPNGSRENIAGVCNATGNVLGLMPHPERAAEAILGSDDGRLLLEGLLRQGTAA